MASDWRVVTVQGHPIIYSKSLDRRVTANEAMERIAALEADLESALSVGGMEGPWDEKLTLFHYARGWKTGQRMAKLFGITEPEEEVDGG